MIIDEILSRKILFFLEFWFFEEQMSQSRNVNSIYKDFDQDDMNVGSEIVHIQNFALF